MNVKFLSTTETKSRTGSLVSKASSKDFKNERPEIFAKMKSFSGSVLNLAVVKGKESSIFSRTSQATRAGFTFKPVQPKRQKAKIVVWTDLSVSAIDRLNESTSSDHIKQVLADIFMLDEYRTNDRKAIVMDLFFSTLQFAKREKFSPEKTSAFFSIIKSIFEMCIETPFGNQDYTLDFFTDLLQCHSLNCPPFSIVIFTPENVMRISQYTKNTFFRHFEMYKYAFTPQIELDLKLHYIGMPPSPPPLEEVSEEVVEEESVPSSVDSGQEIAAQDWVMLENDLKNEVTEILSVEAKKIDDKINQHMTAAADALYSKLTQLVTKGSNDATIEKDVEQESLP